MRHDRLSRSSIYANVAVNNGGVRPSVITCIIARLYVRGGAAGMQMHVGDERAHEWNEKGKEGKRDRKKTKGTMQIARDVFINKFLLTTLWARYEFIAYSTNSTKSDDSVFLNTN